MQTDPVTDDPPADTPPMESCAEKTDKYCDEDDTEDEMANDELYDEDPTWSPEEIDEAYQNLHDDDDSVETSDNPG